MPEKVKFVLYLNPQQLYGHKIQAIMLFRFMLTSGLMDRCFSTSDLLIKAWIANPSIYPEELKGQRVFLWKSRLVSRGRDHTAHLLWGRDRVHVHWSEFDIDLGEDSPTLLKPVE